MKNYRNISSVVMDHNKNQNKDKNQNQRLLELEEDINVWFLSYLLNPHMTGSVDIEVYKNAESPLIWLCAQYLINEKNSKGQPYGITFFFL